MLRVASLLALIAAAVMLAPERGAAEAPKRGGNTQLRRRRGDLGLRLPRLTDICAFASCQPALLAVGEVRWHREIADCGRSRAKLDGFC